MNKLKDSAYRITIEEIDTNSIPHIIKSSNMCFRDDCRNMSEPLGFLICEQTYDDPILFVLQLLTELQDTHEMGMTTRTDNHDKEMALKCINIIKECFDIK